MVAILFSHLFTNYRIAAAPYGRWKLKMHGLVVHIVNLNRHNLLECLYTALNLHSLGGFIAKTFYKLFGIGNLLLLVSIRSELLFMTFLTKFDKLIVLDLVIIYHSA